MSGNSINEIDFELWANLASTDPQKFEELRQDKISNFINQSSRHRQQRLLGLQWQIDTIRNQHSTVAACLAISELMWETFQELSEVLQLQAKSGLTAPIPTLQANIISFPKKEVN